MDNGYIFNTFSPYYFLKLLLLKVESNFNRTLCRLNFNLLICYRISVFIRLLCQECNIIQKSILFCKFLFIKLTLLSCQCIRILIQSTQIRLKSVLVIFHCYRGNLKLRIIRDRRRILNFSGNLDISIFIYVFGLRLIICIMKKNDRIFLDIRTCQAGHLCVSNGRIGIDKALNIKTIRTFNRCGTRHITVDQRLRQIDHIGLDRDNDIRIFCTNRCIVLTKNSCHLHRVCTDLSLRF